MRESAATFAHAYSETDLQGWGTARGTEMGKRAKIISAQWEKRG